MICTLEAEENDFCSSVMSPVNKIKIHVYCCSREWTHSLDRTQYYSLCFEHVELKTGRSRHRQESYTCI